MIRVASFSHVDESTYPKDPDEVPPSDPANDDPDGLDPDPREVKLQRDPDLGFGFVAGSERPVVIRFVTEGQPNDLVCELSFLQC